MTQTRRRFDATELIVASHNKGKISEIGDLLEPFGVTSVGADALGLPEPEETGSDFIAKAVLKARAAAMATGRPALADDSGLAVDALDGAPGIYSARWAQTWTRLPPGSGWQGCPSRRAWTAAATHRCS